VQARQQLIMKWGWRSKSKRVLSPLCPHHENEPAAFLLSHGSTLNLFTGWVGLRSGLTLTVFKGIPCTDSFIPYVRLSCHLSSIIYALSCLYSVIPSFPGEFFTPAFQCPHQVERVGALGDGGKWVCGLERIAKQKHCIIYSFGLSLPSFPCRRNDWPLHMHAC
jgi:Methyltransferase domain